ncbi:MAG: hypothetical protein HY900_20875 [Deltaproteobacteria bacterium]|nr:hypothetical protein [Deltaproteobacteria bacterium]
MTGGAGLPTAIAWPASGFSVVIRPAISPGNGKISERLGRPRPGLRCLFLSGYPAAVIAERGMLGEGPRLLEKPFAFKALAAKVREALGGKTGARVESAG